MRGNRTIHIIRTYPHLNNSTIPFCFPPPLFLHSSNGCRLRGKARGEGITALEFSGGIGGANARGGYLLIYLVKEGLGKRGAQNKDCEMNRNKRSENITMKSKKDERRIKPYSSVIHIQNLKNVIFCTMCRGFALGFKQDSFHRRPKGWRLKAR